MLRESNYKKSGIIKSVTLVIISLIMLLLCFSGFGGSIARAEGNEVEDTEVTSPVKTGYIFNIPCKGLEGYISLADKNSLNYTGVMKAFSRNELSVTVIFGIVNVKIFDNPLIVSVPVKLDFPAATSVNLRIDFKEDVKVDIRAKYFDLLKNGDFSKIRATILVEGRGVQVMEKFGFPMGYFTSLSGCKAEVGDVSGLYPDNGDAEKDVSKSWLELIYDVLTNAFKWKLSYTDFKTWVVIIGVSILGIILLPMVIKFIKAIFS